LDGRVTLLGRESSALGAVLPQEVKALLASQEKYMKNRIRPGFIALSHINGQLSQSALAPPSASQNRLGFIPQIVIPLVLYGFIGS
jgi:hypothetical protein